MSIVSRQFRQCIYIDSLGEECTEIAKFGPKDGLAETCKHHRKTNSIETKRRNILCKITTCLTRSSYGPLGGKPVTCARHKEASYINLVEKLCEVSDCKVRPSFGVDKPMRCAQHRRSGDIDLVSKKCKVSGCGKNVGFGPKGGRPLRCGSHRKSTDINLKVGSCTIDGCGVIASYGYDNKRRRCATHREDDMKLIANRACKSQQPPYSYECSQAGTPKYDNFCTHCFVHLFPDDPRTLLVRKKSKELHVLSYLYNNVSKKFKHDKPLMFGSDCPSMRRIDAYLWVNGVILAIEVDEHQHKKSGYSTAKEKKRYLDFLHDYGGRMVFIRFNPDAYWDSKGRRKNPRMDRRLEILKNEIIIQLKRIRDNCISQIIEVVKLYYDGYT